jgi:hypothetical protein
MALDVLKGARMNVFMDRQLILNCVWFSVSDANFYLRVEDCSPVEVRDLDSVFPCRYLQTDSHIR